MPRSDAPHGESHHSHGLMHEIFGPLRDGYSAIRRGKVRPLLLALLHEKPMHGYQVMQELETRTGGRWRPSAGTIYPTLQQLEDEGLVRAEEVDGRKTYQLTDEGRAAAEDSPLLRHPWFDPNAGPAAIDLRRLAVQLVGATIQVQRVGSEEAQREAREILVDGRRRLYQLLADDDAGEIAIEAIDDLHEEHAS